MKQPPFSLLVTCLLYLALHVPLCAAVEIHPLQPMTLVNHHVSLLIQQDSPKTADNAFAAFNNGQFIHNRDIKVSFGFTDKTIWAVLPLTNTTGSSVTQVIKVDNAWLDMVDVFILQEGNVTHSLSLGDMNTFSSRPRNERVPTFDYAFPPGDTYVLFKVSGKDPITLPIYIGSEASAKHSAIQNAYFYGALYGAMLILLVYNLVLYSTLNEQRHLFYSLYLLAFAMFNFVYTGHGYWLIWPNVVNLQQWLMPVLMFCYIFSSIVFTIVFLDARIYLPRLYARRYWIYGAMVGLAMAIIVSGERSFAVMAQLVVLTGSSLWMIGIGYFSYRGGNPMATYFLPAIMTGTGGATFSSLATWGIIPYSQWAFRGIEIGMLLEMALLSMFLGFRFRQVNQARQNAENNARLDPLTELYNRRAFAELVEPIWQLGKRKDTTMSIVLLDVDWFKRVNDQFGHSVGDEVLGRIALALKSRLRKSDIALRWGGEEFLLFLPDTHADKAEQLAESLRTSIEGLAVIESMQITISAGVACAEPKQMALDKLISRADNALYLAKQGGRNRVVVDSLL